MSELRVLLPADLHDALQRVAALNDRSVSAQVRVAIREHLEIEQPEEVDR
jgi:predicted transcriptional regulator